MKRNIVLAAMLLGAGLQAQAALTVYGNFKCSAWSQDTTNARKGWVLGYVSGINTALGEKDGDLLDNVNKAEEIYDWVDNYCSNHPDDSVQKASTQFYLDLRRRYK